MAQATVKSNALETQAVFSHFTIEQWMWTLFHLGFYIQTVCLCYTNLSDLRYMKLTSIAALLSHFSDAGNSCILLLECSISPPTKLPMSDVTHWLAQPTWPWRTGKAVMLRRAGYHVSPTNILCSKGLPKGKKTTFLLVIAFCHSYHMTQCIKSLITKG